MRPHRITAALATLALAAGAGPATPAASQPRSVVFDDICSGVKLTLANPGAHPLTYEVNGDTYPFPPGLTPEPLLMPAGPVTVTVVETGRRWTHTWTPPAGCNCTPGAGT